MSTDFESLPDLASERFGGAALLANDEFFAPKESLVAEKAPVWDPDAYTDRGKWMDGWETRRRREPGHDFCVVRLGLPGIVRGVVVDTSHFRGNYPEACSLDACTARGGADPGEDATWTGIVPRTLLRGDTRNEIPVTSPWRFTHVRLHIYPDGGVARLRVHGEVVPDPALRPPPGSEQDLASLDRGGRVISASDAFFGPPHKLLLPDAPRGMHDGWETKRRRGPGHDWVVVALGARGIVRRVEVDTTFFKGNAPGSCALDVCDAPGAAPDAVLGPGRHWAPALAQVDLEPHASRVFAQIIPAGPATHARFSIFPDGGVARLRLFGTVEAGDRANVGVRFLDVLPPADAEAELFACCGSAVWARRMAAARPFFGISRLREVAREIWWGLGREGWVEAFAAHPRIGERAAQGVARAEQAAVLDAAESELAAMADANREYEARFGHVYVVCATGRGAGDLLAECRARLTNGHATELGVAAGEQAKITELRLERLVAG